MADPTEVAVEAGDLLRALNGVRWVIPWPQQRGVAGGGAGCIMAGEDLKGDG